MVLPSTRTLDLPAQALLAAVGDILQAGGAVWLVVSGWSMTPLIRPGDRVLLERHPSVRVGDIIFANCNGRAVLHRVTQVAAQSVSMRGDNGRLEGEVIDRASIIGLAVLLERGSVRIALRPSRRFGWRPFVRYGLARLWLEGVAAMRSINRQRVMLHG